MKLINVDALEEAYQKGYEEGYSQGYIDGSTGADMKGGAE